MKFTIRDILWLTVVVAMAAGWFVDHGRLQWQIMLNDWAREMHPEGGRNVTSGAGGGATFFVSPVPPAVMPSDVTEGKSPRPFSFLGEPISESNFEPKSTASFSPCSSTDRPTTCANIWANRRAENAGQIATPQFTTGKTRICVFPEENRSLNRT